MKVKKLIALAVIIGLMLSGYLFRDELGLLRVGEIALRFMWVLLAGTFGVALVVAPIFIWLALVLGALFGGIYLILWSFKIYTPKTQTPEQLHRAEILHKKYGTLAKVFGILLVGCVVYYFFVFPK